MPELKDTLSFVLPCYNESKSIAATVEHARAAAASVTDVFELVIVDDGSTDGSKDILRGLAERHSWLRLVEHARNRGYGAALQSGFRVAQHAMIFYADADGQFEFSELKKLWEMRAKFDVVIGYRSPRNDPWLRRTAGSLWTIAINKSFGLQVRDLDCAFKLFPRELVTHRRLHSRGAFISAELLLAAREKGMRLGQCPVSHFPRQHGSATGLKPPVVAQALLDAWQVNLRG